jgi:hypothetical protein
MIDRTEIESTFTMFVVRALGYWGKGKTIPIAKSNCVKAGAHKNDKMLTHWGTPDIKVLSDGSVTAINMVFLGEV